MAQVAGVPVLHFRFRSTRSGTIIESITFIFLHQAAVAVGSRVRTFVEESDHLLCRLQASPRRRHSEPGLVHIAAIGSGCQHNCTTIAFCIDIIERNRVDDFILMHTRQMVFTTEKVGIIIFQTEPGVNYFLGIYSSLVIHRFAGINFCIQIHFGKKRVNNRSGYTTVRCHRRRFVQITIFGKIDQFGYDLVKQCLRPYL